MEYIDFQTQDVSVTVTYYTMVVNNRSKSPRFCRISLYGERMRTDDYDLAMHLKYKRFFFIGA
jgi:hypothetical protein